MKFGKMGDLRGQHPLKNFGELWSTFRAAQIFDRVKIPQRRDNILLGILVWFWLNWFVFCCNMLCCTYALNMTVHLSVMLVDNDHIKQQKVEMGIW